MKKFVFLIAVSFIFLFAVSVSAYKTYNVGDSELEAGYTPDMSPGDRINFQMGEHEAHVSVLSVVDNSAQISIFAHGWKRFYTQEHPDVDIFPDVQKFEMTEDNYYDLKVTLNSAVKNDDGTRVASITLQKIHEEIPEGTEIYYGCWKYYECRDGSKIKYCDYTSNGMCGCHGVSSSECPDEEEVLDNSESQNCFVHGDGETQIYNLDGKTFEVFSHIEAEDNFASFKVNGELGVPNEWSSPQWGTPVFEGGYVIIGQLRIVLKEVGYLEGYDEYAKFCLELENDDACEPECNCIMMEKEYSQCILSDCSAEQMPCEFGCNHETGKCEVESNSQVSEEVICRFIGSDTKQSCWHKSANAGEAGCDGIEECTTQVFGLGGSDLNWYSSCGGYAHTVLDYEDDYIEFYCGPDEEYSSEKFSRASWVCEDDEEIVEQGGDGSCKSEATWRFYATQYCAENSASGELDDFRAFESCGRDLVIKPQVGKVSSMGNEPGVNYICQGCQLEGKCYPLGYRKSGNYCSEGGFLEQVSDEGSCENNFECKSNLCIDSSCVSSGVWQRFMNWFKGLFG
ncbi:MAG: hypothetical protein KKD18_05020 [Nanoarchaeota archaeon]|nr:hypothetical protein [Nanoarchaeota archaeon]MBU0977752.1 hypothetical protein [Nanoarchaeota archaeon]